MRPCPGDAPSPLFRPLGTYDGSVPSPSPSPRPGLRSALICGAVGLALLVWGLLRPQGPARVVQVMVRPALGRWTAGALPRRSPVFVTAAAAGPGRGGAGAAEYTAPSPARRARATRRYVTSRPNDPADDVEDPGPHPFDDPAREEFERAFWNARRRFVGRPLDPVLDPRRKSLADVAEDAWGRAQSWEAPGWVRGASPADATQDYDGRPEGSGDAAAGPEDQPLRLQSDGDGPALWSPKAAAVQAVVDDVRARQAPPIESARLMKGLAAERVWADPTLAPGEWPLVRKAYLRLLDGVIAAAPAMSVPELSHTVAALLTLSRRATRFRPFLVEEEGARALDAITARAAAPATLSELTGSQAAGLLLVYGHLTVRDETLLAALQGRLLDAAVLPTLRASDVAAVLWALARVSAAPPALLDGLTAHVCGLETVLRGFNAQHISDALWACAALGYGRGTLVPALVRRLCAPGVLEEADAPAVANSLWALGALRVRNVTAMQLMARRVLHPGFLLFFSERGLANVAWAFAELGYRNELLMTSIADRLMTDSFVYLLKPRETAHVAWAYAKLGVPHEVLLLGLANRVMQPGFLERCRPAEVVSIAWAYAELGLTSRVLMGGLARQLLLPATLEALDAHDLSTVAWACATLRFRDAGLLRALARRVAEAPELRRGFDGAAAADVAWAYAVLRVPAPDLMEALEAPVLEAAAEAGFAAPEIARTAWAYAALGLCRTELLQRLADAAVRVPEASFYEVDAGGLSDLCWAYTRCGVRPEPLLRRIADRLVADDHLLPTFTPAGLANVSAAFATFDVRHPPLTDRIAEALQTPATLLRLEPPAMALVAWAFARLDAPHAALLRTLARHAVRGGYLRGFAAGDLARLLGAYAALGVPSDALFAAAEAYFARGDRLRGLGGGQVVELLWAYDRLGLASDVLSAAAAERVMELPPEERVRAVGALAERGVPAPALCVRVGLWLREEGVMAAGAAGVVELLRALRRLGALSDALVEGLARQVRGCSAADAVALHRALGAEGAGAETGLRAAVEARLAALAEAAPDELADAQAQSASP